MKLSRYATVCIVVAVVCSVAVGAVAAQDGEQAADVDDGSDEQETYLIAVNSDVRVVSAEWDSGTVELVIESDALTTVTITDASQRIEGAIDIRRDTVRVPEGERISVEFTVADSSRAAVTVAARGDIVGIGSDGGLGLFDGEKASWAEVRAGALGGVLAGLVAAGVLSWYAVARDPDEPVEVIA